MKTHYPSQMQKQKEIVIQEVPKMVSGFECVFGAHPATLLHRGTAYCRRCYDERNLFGKLIDS